MVESKAEQVAQKIKFQDQKDWKKIILISSGVMAGIFMLMGIVEMLNPHTIGFMGGYDVDVRGDEIVSRSPLIDGMILATLSFLGPYGFYAQAKFKRIKKIEAYLPDFLRDVAEAGRFGMTLAEAIVVASSGKYGLLTPEIKKMAAQIEWGVPASEALRLFSERVNTTLVKRTVAIIVKSSDAGGNVADVLTIVAHAVKEEQIAEKEKAIQMVTYLAVIYIAYMVFLVTILIMASTFLPAMQAAGSGATAMEGGGGGGAGGGGQMINVEILPKLSLIFFGAAIIHGAGDGIVAGILETGRIVSGFRHSFILLLMGYIMLGVMV